MSSSHDMVHHTVLVVDVERFTRADRTNIDQVAIREQLYDCVRAGFSGTALTMSNCHVEDRGDGILLLLPASVPKNKIVTDLVDNIAAAVAVVNRDNSAGQEFRLRVALHAGEVHHDEHGVSGADVTKTFRLVDAEDFKAALRHEPESSMGLIVSDELYQSVLRHFPESPAGSRRQITVQVKEATMRAWISFHGKSAPLRHVRRSSVAKLPPELADELSSGQVVACCGTELGGWSVEGRLARVMRDRLSGTAHEVSDLATVATYYEAAKGRHALISLIRDECQQIPDNARNLMDSASAFHFHAFVTPRWDALIENSLRKKRHPYTVIADDTDIPFIGPTSTPIVKLRGTSDRPATIAVTERDLAESPGRRPSIDMLVTSFAATSTLLMFGFPRSTHSLGRILNVSRFRLGHLHRRTYLLQPGLTRHDRERWQSQNVEAIDMELDELRDYA